MLKSGKPPASAGGAVTPLSLSNDNDMTPMWLELGNNKSVWANSQATWLKYRPCAVETYIAAGFGITYNCLNFLLERDVDPANDNTPMFLAKVA